MYVVLLYKVSRTAGEYTPWGAPGMYVVTSKQKKGDCTGDTQNISLFAQHAQIVKL